MNFSPKEKLAHINNLARQHTISFIQYTEAVNVANEALIRFQKADMKLKAAITAAEESEESCLIF